MHFWCTPFLYASCRGPASLGTCHNARISNKSSLAFMDDSCSSKIRQSVVVMSVHDTALCRDFRSFSYVGERALRRTRKQLSEKWTSNGVHFEFCVACVISSARSPLRETENLRRVCHGRNILHGWSSICCTRKGTQGRI